MRNYKVLDTFMFNGEFEMLKMRLDYLYDSVDLFIICESDHTQSGLKKNLTYPGNEHLFNEYKDKIHYLVYNVDPSDLEKVKENRFHLEKKHMDYIRDNSVQFSDENTVTMLSGVDEFPDKKKFDEMWERIKDMNMDAISYKMKTYYCSPLCELDIDCFGTTVVNDFTFRKISRFSDLREYCFQSPHIEDGGWHLSFFHSPEEIKKKIESYAHSEYNTPDITDLENIKRRMYNQDDVLNRSEINVIKHNKISENFPIEFYRHDIFFRNTFGRVALKPQMKLRRNSTMQIPLEIENLQSTVAKTNPKVVLEIGTANGGTLARWFEIPSVETVISVDYPIGIHGGQGFEERTYVISDSIEQGNLCKKEFYPVNGDSRHPYLVQRVRELLDGRKIDFLFIDGDHTYNGVKGDFEIYKEFLHDDSLVGFHDVIDSKFHRDENCFVANFWNELKKEHKSHEFIYTQLLDAKVLPDLHRISAHRGGFGGIGLIEFKKKPEIELSLVVPVYNNVNLTIENINKTLESSKHISEVVVYSNGTSTEENEILLSFANNNPIVKVFINEKPIGFVKAVNEGIKKCKNEYILCLNSDAFLYSDWEDRLLPLCENENNGLIGPVLQDDFILGCAFIMKKSILNKVGLLNEGFGMGYHDDGEITDRILRNGYNLGYCEHLFGYDENTRNINFPLVHIQGVSFMQIEQDVVNEQLYWNESKLNKFRNTNKVKVCKNLDYEDVKSLMNSEDLFLVVNYSGDDFEKIRFDEEIVKYAHIFECTPEMNINNLINSITIGKDIEYVAPLKKKGLTWLAKFDDYASMGILSQRIIENLKTDVSCHPIIGRTETKNQLIFNYIDKPNNYDLGIMFAYPDMYPVLYPYKTKVIYTGVDTTGGIPNFAQNANNADFILTPSNKSKERMENLGVTKPIFVFPHGIDPNVFTYKERKITDKFKFLYVGECSDRKGIFQLLDAFVHLFKNNPNVELHIKSNTAMLFYNGEDIDNFLESNPNIFWHVSDEGHDVVTKLYEECHAYVYPSRADTFGMTLIEAMACGLPIISTNEPGATELIQGRYEEIETKNVPVKDHPWMLGEWGEPSVTSLINKMEKIYKNYDSIISSSELKENSDFVRENYSWDKVTNMFESSILPNLTKTYKVLTLLTSFHRPHHIKNVINSLKSLKEDGLKNHTYIVENTDNFNIKDSVVETIKENIDENFTLYVSEFNMGQRGALLQMLEDINLDDYDFIQFTDQDNLFEDRLSTYCDILNEHRDITFVTGYMSKEHGELGWRQTRFGNLCEKRSLRAGHMFMRVEDLKKLLPIHLDGEYGEVWNSSWNAGLDWELQYWNKNSIGKNSTHNFVLCVPGGVLHKGIDSTMYNWDVEANEYSIEELKKIRYN